MNLEKEAFFKRKKKRKEQKRKKKSEDKFDFPHCHKNSLVRKKKMYVIGVSGGRESIKARYGGTTSSGLLQETTKKNI